MLRDDLQTFRCSWLRIKKDPLRASPQGQRDENANGDVIGNEHASSPRADCAEIHLSHRNTRYTPRSSAYV
jgi:hypothetical protein